MGSSEAIRLTLHRLSNKKEIHRITHGIYARPQISKLFGEVLPSAEEVAQAISKRDKIKIIPTGVTALHALGLSAQIPLNLVYLTDGPPRKISVGNKIISLKKTTPKNLLSKGAISGLIIQALRALGQEEVTEVEKHKILTLLKNEDPKKLKHDILLAPNWIQKIMFKALPDE
tara:strand:- start:23927 stop:24445 length:519 start_codon:yes stop_codon:yes gene_type:complete